MWVVLATPEYAHSIARPVAERNDNHHDIHPGNLTAILESHPHPWMQPGTLHATGDEHLPGGNREQVKIQRMFITTEDEHLPGGNR